MMNSFENPNSGSELKSAKAVAQERAKGDRESPRESGFLSEGEMLVGDPADKPQEKVGQSINLILVLSNQINALETEKEQVTDSEKIKEIDEKIKRLEESLERIESNRQQVRPDDVPESKAGERDPLAVDQRESSYKTKSQEDLEGLRDRLEQAILQPVYKKDRKKLKRKLDRVKDELENRQNKVGNEEGGQEVPQDAETAGEEASEGEEGAEDTREENGEEKSAEEGTDEETGEDTGQEETSPENTEDGQEDDQQETPPEDTEGGEGGQKDRSEVKIDENSDHSSPEGVSGEVGKENSADSSSEDRFERMEGQITRLAEALNIQGERIESLTREINRLRREDPARVESVAGATESFAESETRVSGSERRAAELFMQKDILEKANRPMNFFSGTGRYLSQVLSWKLAPVPRAVKRELRTQVEARKTAKASAEEGGLGVSGGGWFLRTTDVNARIKQIQTELDGLGYATDAESLRERREAYKRIRQSAEQLGGASATVYGVRRESAKWHLGIGAYINIGNVRMKANLDIEAGGLRSVPEDHNEDSGGEGSRERIQIQEGALVQWRKDGEDKFEGGRKVTGLSHGGRFAFVEGQPKGVPVNELKVVENRGGSEDWVKELVKKDVNQRIDKILKEKQIDNTVKYERELKQALDIIRTPDQEGRYNKEYLNVVKNALNEVEGKDWFKQDSQRPIKRYIIRDILENINNDL